MYADLRITHSHNDLILILFNIIKIHFQTGTDSYVDIKSSSVVLQILLIPIW